MAKFTREYLDNDVPGNEAWKKITDHLKGGSKSVEVLSRIVDGKKVWELRAWDGLRGDKSNAGNASPNKEY